MKKLILILSLLSSVVSFSQCVETLDQLQNTSTLGTYGNDQWQSFVAGISGKLTKVEVFKNGIQAVNCVFSIYADNGTNGQLLYSDAFNFGTVSTGWLAFNIPIGSAPILTPGNQYTFRIQDSGGPGFTCNENNPYQGDYFSDVYGSQPWDLEFETYVTPDPPPTISIVSQVDPSCAGGNDGAISTAPANGTPDYTFSWSPGGQTVQNPTNFTAGVHTVTVTDANGCSASVSATLSDPPAITVSAGADQAVCADVTTIDISGSVTVAGGGSWLTSGSGTFGNNTDLTTTYTPSAADIISGAVTLTLTSTDNGGCTPVNDNLVVTIFALPTVTAGADQTVCEGTSVTLSAVHSPGALSWDQGVTDGVAFTPSVGSLVYTATITDGNGCVASDNLTVTVNANPNPTLSCSDTDQIICAGDNVDFTVNAGFSTYEFFVNGSSVQGPGTANAFSTTTLVNSDVVTVDVGSSGCVVTAPQSFTMTVNANPNPTLNCSDTDQIICAGDNVDFTASAGSSTYEFFVNGSSVQGPDAATIYSTTTLANNDVVTVEAVSNGCSTIAPQSFTMTVNANPSPTLNCSDTDQIICAGDNVDFTASAGSSTYEFFVNGGSVQGPDAATTYSTTTLANNDVVTVVAGSNGCFTTAPQSFTMTVNTVPTASFSTLLDKCENENPYALVEGAPAGGTYSGPGVNLGNFDPSAPGLGTHNLMYVYTDGNSCSDTAYQSINVLAAPAVSAGLDQTICAGTSAAIAATGALSYSWDSGLGAGSSHNVSPVSTTSYVVTGSGGNGCQATDTVTISVNALPAVNFSPLPDMCLAGNPYTLTEGSPAGGTYSGPGVTSPTLDPGTAGSGTHTIVYNYTDGGTGCSSSDSATVLVYNNPNVVASASNTTLCDGNTVVFTGSGASTYSWNNSVTDGVAYTPGVGATHYVVTGSDVNGCSGSDSVLVTVYPLPTVNAGMDMQVCEGTSVTLSASGATSYSWNGGVVDATPFTPPIGNNIYIVTGVDINGCENKDTTSVLVNPNPVLIVSPDQNFCLGDTLTLTVSGADNYDWDSGAGSGSNYQVSPISSVIVSVVGTYATTGCFASRDITLTLDDPTVIDAGADETICDGFTVYLSATGGTNYYWTGPGISNGGSQDINFVVDTTAYYVVDVTTALGCVYSDSLLVSVSNDPNCTIETVTSITPNGDGVNDTWRITGIESYPDNTVTIYNRWGDVIFEETGYDNSTVIWDGLDQAGKARTAGTYYYLIQITNGPSQTGWVQLLK